MNVALTSLGRFIELAFEGLLDALEGLLRGLIGTLDLGYLLLGPAMFLFWGNRVMLVFDQFLDKLQTVIPTAALQTALENFPAPQSLKGRALRADKAYMLVTREIILNATSAVGGRLPFALRVYNLITMRSKVFSFILNPNFEKFLGIILKPFKVTVLRIASLGYRALTIAVQFALAASALLLLSGFVVAGEEKVLEQCFPQSAPRKRFKVVGGKSIRRRTPGGSPP